MSNDPNRYPKGMNRRKVQALIDHYDHQADADAIAEADAAYEDRKQTLMSVPVELVDEVRKLIARRAG